MNGKCRYPWSALGSWQEGRWREFTAPWHRLFPSRQLHTVTRTDPVSRSTVLEFPRKNLRKPTEATADPQLLELNPKNGRVNMPQVQRWRGRQGYWCREWGKGVNFGSGVCVSKLVTTEVVCFCGWLQRTSKAVNLTPLSSVCWNTLNHMFSYDLTMVVAEAGVYSAAHSSAGQLSKAHFPTEPPVVFLPQ